MSCVGRTVLLQRYSITVSMQMQADRPARVESPESGSFALGFFFLWVREFWLGWVEINLIP